MPALPVIANCFRVAVNWRESSTSQTATNVMHFLASGKTAADIFTLLSATNAAPIYDLSPTTMVCETMAVTPLDGSSATLIDTPDPNHWAGGQNGEFSPASSIVVSLKTQQRGRSHRGRIYLPMTVASFLTDGHISGALAAQLRTSTQTFIDTVASGGAHMAVASYKLASALNVSEVVVLSAIGTQRRRQERVRYP